MDSTWIESWNEDDQNEVGPVVTFEEHEAIYGVLPSEDDRKRPELEGCLLVPGMDTEEQWESRINEEGD